MSKRTARVILTEDHDVKVSVECSSEEGITVGLIDTLMTAANALQGRDLAFPEAVEALKDLRASAPLKKLLMAVVAGIPHERIFEVHNIKALEDAMKPLKTYRK